MHYEVYLTPLASVHIDETVRYIAWSLMEPNAARRWRLSLLNEIAKLESMPARFPLVDREPWRTRGLRKMPYRNFLVYFYVDDERGVVSVTAVVYGRRDQMDALEKMDGDQK